MWYGECKIYNDGSHYIGIPHTTRYVKKRPKPPEELITISENDEGSDETMSGPSNYVIPFEEIEGELVFEEDEKLQNDENNTKKISKNKKILTKKEYFNELYAKYIDLKKRERKKIIIKEMLSYFKNEQECKEFVEKNFERKIRNLICRRVRMSRKANLANFNYFVTLTYDDAKHTEYTFKKKLKITLQNFVARKNWKYMGVWERAPKTKRLHFHGLFNIPDDKLPGEITPVRDFNTRTNQMQISYQSSYFNDRFGRSDFKEIDEYENKLGSAIAYLMKYIEKTDEKIVYSKNLPQYFISDILEDDIVCPIGQEDKKILLFDDFYCLKEGELMGRVCPEVIEQMPTAN